MANFDPSYKSSLIDIIVHNLYHKYKNKSVLKRYPEVHIERLIVKAYLRRVTNEVNTAADLFELLPSMLHKYLPDNLPKDSAHLVISLSFTQIQMFRVKNQEDYDLIKQRAMLDLLLK